MMELLSSKIYNKPKRPVKILQMGEGNFLRGFFDYFIQELNDKTDFEGSICAVQPRGSHNTQRFKKQDCLYDSITEGLKDGKAVSKSQVIDVIDDIISPYDEYDKYLEMAKSPDLEVYISNTTESGIKLDTSDIDFSNTPNTFPSKLLAFLKTRYDHFDGAYEAGLFIIPCELITQNGDTLKSVLEELAHAKGFDDAFVDWLVHANKYYNTLVDRITPGYPKDDIDKWQKEWGYVDDLCDKGEVYHLWAVQGDNSLLKVLPFNKTDLNIIFCDDISPYKELKVKILNGSHTMMVSCAHQLGFKVVNKTVADERFKTLFNRYNNEEVFPTIDLDQAQKEDFKNAVYDRFANPYIQHLWTSIMLNSMSKYKERILPVVVQLHKNTGKLAKLSLFGMASLFSLYAVKDKDGNCIVSDDAEHMEMWAQLYDGSHSNDQIIDAVLDLEMWEFDFDRIDGAREFVKQAFNIIRTQGMDVALNWILELGE